MGAVGWLGSRVRQGGVKLEGIDEAIDVFLEGDVATEGSSRT